MPKFTLTMMQMHKSYCITSCKRINAKSYYSNSQHCRCFYNGAKHL